jgi:hypothetical protein
MGWRGELGRQSWSYTSQKRENTSNQSYLRRGCRAEQITCGEVLSITCFIHLHCTRWSFQMSYFLLFLIYTSMHELSLKKIKESVSFQSSWLFSKGQDLPEYLCLFLGENESMWEVKGPEWMISQFTVSMSKIYLNYKIIRHLIMSWPIKGWYRTYPAFYSVVPVIRMTPVFSKINLLSCFIVFNLLIFLFI